MKRTLKTFARSLALALSLALCQITLGAQGVPFLLNYSSEEYGAHNRNFDITTSDDGVVFVANFEGLLIYDKARWQVLHTRGIQRLTAVFKDSSGRIWAGGYDYMGYVETAKNGAFSLHPLSFKEGDAISGEVTWIWERDYEVQFLTSNGDIYRVDGQTAEILEGGTTPDDGQSRGGDTESRLLLEELDGNLQARAVSGEGLTIENKSGKVLYRFSEDNGLCSNSINEIAYDGHGVLWGATDNGLFAINVPSSFSRFTPNEGLKGEVLSILPMGGRMYVGTIGGLFRQDGLRFTQVGEIRHACWQLCHYGDGLLAATSNGVYRISPGGGAVQLTSENTTSVFSLDGGFLSGEIDGLYFNRPGGERQQVSSLEKVTKILQDKEGDIFIQSLYGRVAMRQKGENEFSAIKIGNDTDQIATLVESPESVYILVEDGLWTWRDGKIAEVTLPKDIALQFSLFSYADSEGYMWLTNQEGKDLYVVKDGKKIDSFEKWTSPLDFLTVRALYASSDRHVWVGGSFGIICLSPDDRDPFIESEPKVRIRSIRAQGDSILWGGSGHMPKELPKLSPRQRNLTFNYALEHPAPHGGDRYRHRINSGAWSAWSEETRTRLINQPYGDYTFEVQAIDAFGRLSDTQKVGFSIAFPFYMRWYMVLLYLAGIVYLVYQGFQYRMRKLLKDKEKLESIVKERTAEVERQRDEIQEKSDSLEKALGDLENAQQELVRQEKMATAGKLTQGLIDRILNPLNYINNFSKLSATLVGDIKENIEDEKDNMDEENYEDTIDTLDMLRQNLQKVEEHGMNTSRTLKAMEELLRDRSGGMEEMDLTGMLQDDFKVLNGYYAKDIEAFGIETSLDVPDHPVHINGNREQLSKSVMSILANGIYAVKKKKNAGVDFTPKVGITLREIGDKVEILLRDNGIGIESTILEKIFDPFFTTKTTGEAAGVGLYLSKEIAQNHGGDISADSVKNEYSEFKITVPALK